MDIVKQKHFVLVHGACHGAWCWFKLKTLLESAGHKVTALDLSAAGINTRKVNDLVSFYDYTLPLLQFMASVPAHEKVVLVGHSYGGLSIALAMDNYPHKISVAVFLNAIMPDTRHAPSYVYEQAMERSPRDETWDTKNEPYLSPTGPETLTLLGPKFVAQVFYQRSPPEDLELFTLLGRPMSLFLNDLSRAKNFSEEGYGSVKRAYVIGTQDISVTPEFHRWVLETIGASTVKEIKGADHMAMLSKPRDLCQTLLDIADEFAFN